MKNDKIFNINIKNDYIKMNTKATNVKYFQKYL